MKVWFETHVGTQVLRPYSNEFVHASACMDVTSIFCINGAILSLMLNRQL